jgi:hypothetical protein
MYILYVHIYLSFFNNNCNNANRNTSGMQCFCTENFLNREIPSDILFKNLQQQLYESNLFGTRH